MKFFVNIAGFFISLISVDAATRQFITYFTPDCTGDPEAVTLSPISDCSTSTTGCNNQGKQSFFSSCHGDVRLYPVNVEKRLNYVAYYQKITSKSDSTCPNPSILLFQALTRKTPSGKTTQPQNVDGKWTTYGCENNYDTLVIQRCNNSDMATDCETPERQTVNQCEMEGSEYRRYRCVAPVHTLQAITYDSSDCTGLPVAVDVWTQYSYSTNGLDGLCKTEPTTGKSLFYNVYEDNRQNITITNRLVDMQFAQSILDTGSIYCQDQQTLNFFPLLARNKTATLPVGSANSYRSYICLPNSKMNITFCTNREMTTGCTSTQYDANTCLAKEAIRQSEQYNCPYMPSDPKDPNDSNVIAANLANLALFVLTSLVVTMY